MPRSTKIVFYSGIYALWIGASAETAKMCTVGEVKSGDLFIRLSETMTFWHAVTGPGSFAPEVPSDAVKLATLHFSETTNDFMLGIEWQLAERSSVTLRNPFVPLMACYANGFYPFAIDETTFTLFRFAGG